MSDITILFLYVAAAVCLALSRLPSQSARSRWLVIAGFVAGVGGIVMHLQFLVNAAYPGMAISLGNAVSLIGLLLALIALFGSIEANLRGMCAGLLILAGLAALGSEAAEAGGAAMSWQIRTHVLTSIIAYGLLTAGAIVAVFALIQDRRLRTVQLSAANQLFAPLETTEKLLFGVAASGFTVLALSVVSGITFVENLFAQHLVHKTTLSLLALVVFGILLVGRLFAGWRGRRAVSLYLAGFAVLSLAYFGSRYILEEVLGRTWS